MYRILPLYPPIALQSSTNSSVIPSMFLHPPPPSPAPYLMALAIPMTTTNSLFLAKDSLSLLPTAQATFLVHVCDYRSVVVCGRAHPRLSLLQRLINRENQYVRAKPVSSTNDGPPTCATRGFLVLELFLAMSSDVWYHFPCAAGAKQWTYGKVTMTIVITLGIGPAFRSDPPSARKRIANCDFSLQRTRRICWSADRRQTRSCLTPLGIAEACPPWDRDIPATKSPASRRAACVCRLADHMVGIRFLPAYFRGWASTCGMTMRN